jgi:hypothetical protein
VMVRKINWAGPCIDQGPLVRETAQFYVYEQGGREHRIKKTDPLVHLEPCQRCMDHPQTQYPRGFDL